MKGLILVTMLAVALGCLATADAQQPVAQPQPTVAQGLLVPAQPILLVPHSRVVCRNGMCAPVAAPAPGSGYQFTRGFFPWRVRYSAWSR